MLFIHSLVRPNFTLMAYLKRTILANFTFHILPPSTPIYSISFHSFPYRFLNHFPTHARNHYTKHLSPESSLLPWPRKPYTNTHARAQGNKKRARLTRHLSPQLFIHRQLNGFPAVHMFANEIVVSDSHKRAQWLRPRRRWNERNRERRFPFDLKERKEEEETTTPLCLLVFARSGGKSIEPMGQQCCMLPIVAGHGGCYGYP